MSDEIKATVERYLSYNWQWPMITQLINRKYGTKYTEAELHGAYNSVTPWGKTYDAHLRQK